MTEQEHHVHHVHHVVKRQKLCNDYYNANEFVPYKKTNHFNAIVDSYLIKEQLEIPDQLIADLKTELAKQKVINVNKIQHQFIKMCLRKLGYQKYYECIPNIKSKLTGERPVVIEKEDAEKLKNMFQQIQEPFEKYKYLLGENRTSFIGYPYVFYKLVELCGLFDILQHLELSCKKSPLKLQGYDKVWSEICKMNGWIFIPTI